MAVVELRLAQKDLDGQRHVDAVLADNELSISVKGTRLSTQVRFTIGTDVRKVAGTFGTDVRGDFSSVVKLTDPQLVSLVQKIGGGRWEDAGSKWAMRADDVFLELEIV